MNGFPIELTTKPSLSGKIHNDNAKVRTFWDKNEMTSNATAIWGEE